MVPLPTPSVPTTHAMNATPADATPAAKQTEATIATTHHATPALLKQLLNRLSENG